ncbi:BCCT family transporter [Texcoconibacillus texcoconensis]|uniref:BCCT family betaine/carnitine transporter n=1 Tax=Texcoconibacillus texcoconensis TaxID=1095777 RepID=A0A840QMM5_9BACI|nr:BCCT family transporter [Texcoconibacillus texcoconensis]MBB5172606.1 BCCT family betaine/carnitine transporter [Texcoconibacillus texcoconensis]
MKRSTIDWPFFFIAILFLIGICASIFLYPDQIFLLFDSLRVRINEALGIIYLWIGLCSLLFLIWVAFSRFGKIKLGKENDVPAFSNVSWLAMIFCAGIGSGILFWGTIEWGYHMNEPLFGFLPHTPSSIEWSAAYGLFHHGPTAWAIYGLPALPIAYLYHVKERPVLKISEACSPILKQHSDGLIGKSLDLFFVISLLGASGTSLGISVPMMSAGVAKITGIERSFILDLGVLFICTALFAFSVFAGLEKGIKFLSNVNIYLIFLILLLVFILGPTVFILEVSTSSVGLIANNFFRLNTWMDPIGQSGLPEKWTVFYWAWWIVYAPFVGLFIAKVSKGRTIKQMILGTIILGPLGCWLFYFILGNYGLSLQLTGQLDITSIIEQGKANEAIISIIHSLPLGNLLVTLFTILAIVFTATTYDTSSYLIAAVTQRSLNNDPIRWNRLFWAFALAIPPAALLFIGGLTTLQAVTIIVALPSTLMMILLSLSFLKLMEERE